MNTKSIHIRMVLPREIAPDLFETVKNLSGRDRATYLRTCIMLGHRRLTETPVSGATSVNRATSTSPSLVRSISCPPTDMPQDLLNEIDQMLESAFGKVPHREL
jgi:hypothetical protein